MTDEEDEVIDTYITCIGDNRNLLDPDPKTNTHMCRDGRER